MQPSTDLGRLQQAELCKTTNHLRFDLIVSEPVECLVFDHSTTTSPFDSQQKITDIKTSLEQGLGAVFLLDSRLSKDPSKSDNANLGYADVFKFRIGEEIFVLKVVGGQQRFETFKDIVTYCSDELRDKDYLAYRSQLGALNTLAGMIKDREGNIVALIMPFVEFDRLKDTLAAVIKSSGSSGTNVQGRLIQLREILREAAELGLAMWDIAPEDIIIKDGRLILLDAGAFCHISERTNYDFEAHVLKPMFGEKYLPPSGR